MSRALFKVGIEAGIVRECCDYLAKFVDLRFNVEKSTECRQG